MSTKKPTIKELLNGKKKLFFIIFLMLSTINTANAIVGCLRCIRSQVSPYVDIELKELKLSKAFIAVFLYKKNINLKNTETRAEQNSEDSNIKTEGRIIFFTNTGKPIEGKDIYTLTYKLNISVKQLIYESNLIDCLFENNSEYLSVKEKEKYKKMDIKIVYINEFCQLLSKETNTREQIKKLLLIEDKEFTGIGRFGPNDKDKLKDLGIDLELANREANALKDAIEYSIKKRKKQYGLDQTSSTSRQSTGSS